MKRKIILFDIDRTLYDSDIASSAHNDGVLETLKFLDLKKLNEVKDKYRSTLKNEREYVPDEYLELLCKTYDLDKLDDLLEIYYGDKYKFTYSNAVYSDVIPVLQNLSQTYDLGIYSEGTKKFQNNKFRSLGLNQYFKDDLVFISEEKDNLESIKRIPEGSIVVDDKETICQFLTDNGIRAIWINRKDKRKSNNFETIYSLLELPAIL